MTNNTTTTPTQPTPPSPKITVPTTPTPSTQPSTQPVPTSQTTTTQPIPTSPSPPPTITTLTPTQTVTNQKPSTTSTPQPPAPSTSPSPPPTPTPSPAYSSLSGPSFSSFPFPKEKIGTMTIWLTSECNLRCKYCFVYKLNENQPPGKMTFETADQLIRFAEQHLKPEGTFWFFGAEPFCNFDVMKYIVEKSTRKGHKWKFGATTNATLLTKDIVNWMKQHNFAVLCSIDGLKDSHDENRVYHDGKGSWDNAWQGLTNIKEILTSNPQVRWTVTPSTVKGLAENIRVFVEDYKITNMPIDFVHETTWTQQDLKNLTMELEIFREHYRKWMDQGIPVFNMWVRDANTAVTSGTRTWRMRCGLGTGSVGIDYDGTIYPCHRFIDSHEIKIGDIYTGFNQTHNEWVEKWLKIPPYCELPQKCLNCNYKKACSGGCIAMNYDILNTTHAIPDTFCTIKQIITNTLGNLCKTLQSNPTFKKLYNKQQPQKQKQRQPQIQPITPAICQMTNDICSCQDKPNK